MSIRNLFSCLLIMAASFTLSARAFAQGEWAVETTFHVGGEGGFDYITVDAKSHRLYVPRSTHTMVIDADSGKTIADIPGQKHNHGVAIAPEAGRGLIGIKPADPVNERRKVGFLSAGKKSLWQCWNISYFTIYYLGQKIAAHQRPDVAGPLGISQVIVKITRKTIATLCSRKRRSAIRPGDIESTSPSLSSKSRSGRTASGGTSSGTGCRPPGTDRGGPRRTRRYDRGHPAHGESWALPIPVGPR